MNWNFKYLSWLRPYQTRKFVLLKQCYYCANMGTFKFFFDQMRTKMFLCIFRMHLISDIAEISDILAEGLQLLQKKRTSYQAYSFILKGLFIDFIWTYTFLKVFFLMFSLHFTVCPKSNDPFYIVTYYINWVTGQTVF